jgi:hypothetical protein
VDGVPEVVIGYGTIQLSNCDGVVVALNGVKESQYQARFVSYIGWIINTVYPYTR